MPLKPLTEGDLELILPWRNAPPVRQAMYTHHEIRLEEHRAWFQRLQKDASRRWYLFHDRAGTPQGVVYFTDLDQEQATGFWGFYARPEARPGIGTRILYEALELAFGELGLRKVNGEALASNTASINLHKKVGFIQEGVFRSQHFDGERPIDVIRLGLLASEWAEHREALRRRVAQLDAMAAETRQLATGNLSSSGRDQTANRRFIVASCKVWHQAGFDRIREELPADWAWVSDPDQLTNAVTLRKPRYIFFLHWNWWVPEELWRDIECVCFHMADVPYGRGGSPLQNLIVAGNKETKLTALRMVAEMDAGPVYTKRSLALEGRAEQVYKHAGSISFEVIRWMVVNQPEPVPQQGEPVLFKRRTPEQSRLPSEGTLEALYDHIRMLDAPTYPLAFLDYGDFRLELSYAEPHQDRLEARVRIQRRPTDNKNGTGPQ